MGAPCLIDGRHSWGVGVNPCRAGVPDSVRAALPAASPCRLRIAAACHLFATWQVGLSASIFGPTTNEAPHFSAVLRSVSRRAAGFYGTAAWILVPVSIVRIRVKFVPWA